MSGPCRLPSCIRDSAKCRQAVHYYDWIDHHSRPYHLTIGDIFEMSPGDTLELLCLDRNFGDLVEQDNLPNVSTDPDRFTRRAYRILFTKGANKHELKGTAYYHGLDKQPRDNWEFELNYEKENWYPLTDQILGSGDGQDKFLKKEFRGRSLTQGMQSGIWNLETRVGWRGPMLRISDLQYLPCLYWCWQKEKGKPDPKGRDCPSSIHPPKVDSTAQG